MEQNDLEKCMWPYLMTKIRDNIQKHSSGVCETKEFKNCTKCVLETHYSYRSKPYFNLRSSGRNI